MKFLFITKAKIILLIVLTLILKMILSTFSFLLFLLCLCLYLYVLRRNFVRFEDAISNNSEVILSPIDGIVKKISKDESYIYLEITTNVLGPLGLYMPISGKLDIEKNKILIKNKNLDSLEMIFSGKYINFTNLWVESGDLGRVCASIGFLGFNSKLTIKISSNSNCLISEGDKVLAGRSVIAGLKE
ncbi:MAG: hypothetical protein N4A33_13620 [Bacteriovoracaceae bacterium]|jgi:hypothetical protein|nr:hypothetical protein [Bacteriovoracaceae bacterium]